MATRQKEKKEIKNTKKELGVVQIVIVSMQRQQKSKIQIAVICGLLLLSHFDICDARKTATNNKSKSKGSGSSSSGSRTQQANPASLSYSGVSPNAAQPKKPSAPAQQPSYAAQAPKPAYNQPPVYPPSNQANQRPVGWNVDNNQRQAAPYPANNQPKPNSPPYPNNNQQFGNPPPQYSQYPNQGPPPAYAQNPSHAGQPNFHQPPPAYSPQQPAGGYHPQPGYNPGAAQPHYNQPQQPAFQPAAQQPQVVNHYHGVQPGGGMTGGGFGGGGFGGGGGFPQQSGGPGLLKTAVVAGAAGLGGAALYNAFKPDSHHDEGKTTVIIVNNTQPAAAPAAVAPAPVEAAPPAQQYPQQPYPQQPYPQQYPQQYDPNQQQYNQQYNPNQPYNPNQQYDPNQQYNPNQQFTAPGQVPLPVPVDGSPAALPPAVDGSVASPSAVEGQVPAVAVEGQVPAVAVDGVQSTPVVADPSAIATSPESTTQLLSDSSPVVSSDVTTPASSTVLANNSNPIVALSARDGEVIEQKAATITNQEAPKASESKTENAGAHLKYSFIVLSLSLVYQLAIKSLL